ncbi:MAG TPA: pyridoxal phosphate-dependent aminotransferase [Burkholderiales bacterium]
MKTASRLLAASRAAEIQPFAVMDVLSRAHRLEAAGRRVIHMEIGEPDFTATPQVVEAAVRALRDGLTAYTATLGLPSLREALAAHYGSRFSKKLSPSRIAVTSGASGGLLLTLALYVNPGDEILVPDPGYPGYRHMVRAFEGVARPLKVLGGTGFQPTLEMVRAAWGRRTRGLLLGSPSNPTGTVIPKAELRKIAEFIAARGGVLIVDEIYQGLVYGEPASTALGLPGEVVVVNSFSKYFCMTGWRLGWVVLPEKRLRDFEKLAQHLFICAPSVAQHAALACFSSDSLKILENRRLEFQRRRDFLLPALARAGLTIPAQPTGAFYLYAHCPAVRHAAPWDGRRFAFELLEREGVAATPGIDFGANETKRYVRFAYTRGMADLEEAAERLRRFCLRKVRSRSGAAA